MLCFPSHWKGAGVSAWFHLPAGPGRPKVTGTHLGQAPRAPGRTPSCVSAGLGRRGCFWLVTPGRPEGCAPSLALPLSHLSGAFLACPLLCSKSGGSWCPGGLGLRVRMHPSRFRLICSPRDPGKSPCPVRTLVASSEKWSQYSVPRLCTRSATA